MSIKIYEAYRCPVSRLNDALDFWREAFAEYSIDYLHKTSLSILSQNLDNKSEIDIMCNLLRDISKHPDDGTEGFNLIESGVDIWIYGNRAYMIPYRSGCWGDCLRGVIKPDFFEEYSYFNSTDKPGHITKKQWNLRRNTWNKVCLKNDYNKSRKLEFKVISPYTARGRAWIQTRYLNKYIAENQEDIIE